MGGQGVRGGCRIQLRAAPSEPSPDVMANFMCRLDRLTGRPDIWLNAVSGCVYEDASG